MKKLIAFFTILLFAAAVSAEIPKIISFQGYVTGIGGDPVIDSTYAITFKLFDVETGGVDIWRETQNINIKRGLYSTYLGSVTPIDLPFDQEYWLEVEMEGVSLSPRYRLGASPYALNAPIPDSVNYAFHAGIADSVVGGGSIDADWQISGANMYSLPAGNVGIGTISPGTKLHVIGDIYATDRFYDSSGDSGSVGQLLSSTGDGSDWIDYMGQLENDETISDTGWYRIAQNITGGRRADALFTLRDKIPGGGHSTVFFRAGVTYGDQNGISMTLISHSKYGAVTFTKLRIIEHGTYDGAYLEVFCNGTGNVEYTIWDNQQDAGWEAVDWAEGEIPVGWTAHEYDIDELFIVARKGDDESFRVSRSGNVGIGTKSPAYKLDVNGRARVQSLAAGATNTVLTHSLGVLQTRTIDSRVWDSSLTDGSGSANHVAKWSDSNTLTNSVIYDNGTNVGIGTTSPTAKLHVAQDVTTKAGIYSRITPTTSRYAAIEGYNPNTSGGAGVFGTGFWGVYGTTAASDGVGVYGEFNSSIYGSIGDQHNGVFGMSNSSSGAGVLGNGSSVTTGVSGTTSAATAFGLRGYNLNSSGTGVFGEGNNVTGYYLPSGSGGAFTGYNYGIYARQLNGASGTQMAAIYTADCLGNNVWINAWSTSDIHYKILGSGTVSTVVDGLKGNTVTLHAPEAPEVLFEDYGEGQLVNGYAHIELDPIFVKNVVIDNKHPLRVFIQLESNENCKGVVVKDKTKTGFSVVELNGGKSNTPFAYHVVCNRADEVMKNGKIARFQDVRFEPGPIPEHEEKQDSKTQNLYEKKATKQFTAESKPPSGEEK